MLEIALVWLAAYIVAGLFGAGREIWNALQYPDDPSGELVRRVLSTGPPGIALLIGAKLRWWIHDDIEGIRGLAEIPGVTVWDHVVDFAKSDAAVFLATGAVLSWLLI